MNFQDATSSNSSNSNTTSCNRNGSNIKSTSSQKEFITGQIHAVDLLSMQLQQGLYKHLFRSFYKGHTYTLNVKIDGNFGSQFPYFSPSDSPLLR